MTEIGKKLQISENKNVKKIIFNSYPRSGSSYIKNIICDIKNVHNIREGLSFRFNYKTTIKNITEKIVSRVNDQKKFLENNLKDKKDALKIIKKLEKCKSNTEYYKTYVREFNKYKKKDINFLFTKLLKGLDNNDFIQDNNDVFYLFFHTIMHDRRNKFSRDTDQD